MFQGWGDSFRGKAALAFAALVAVAVSLSASASADVQVCTPAASPKCSPRGLATDFESGLLYIADRGNNRVDVFKNGGTEPGTPASIAVSDPEWIAVDNVAASPSHHDVYVTTSGSFTVKKFEPDGTLADEFGEQGDGTPEDCQLERAADPIAVGPNGDVYLADSYDKDGPGPGHIFANRIVKFDAVGSCIGEVALFEGTQPSLKDLAVDATGMIYVTDEGTGGEIRQYNSAGMLVRQFQSFETAGLALDAEDHLFAEQGSVDVAHTQQIHFFTEYDSAAHGGAILHRFDYLGGPIDRPPGLASLHTPDGDLFASNPSTGVRYYQLPPPGPVLFPGACKVKAAAPGSVRATLQAEVNPEGKATSFQFEYEPVAGSGTPFANAVSSTPVSLASGAADFELHEAAQVVEPLEPETEYRCRVVARNADSGPTGTVGEEGTFTTREPFTFGPGWSSEVGQTSATLNVEGNPNGAEWTGQVEYVTDAQYQASGFAEALKAPTPPLQYEPTETGMVLKSASLSGLAPATLYHYRLRVTNAEHLAGLVCPKEEVAHGDCPVLEHAFRTYGPEEAGPDHRGYELVSPAEKNSAEVVGTVNGRGFTEANSVLIQAGASNGESVTYTSWISFGEAQGAPATSQYLSRRNQAAERWETDNISPFGFQASIFVPPYLGFTPELGTGLVKAGEPSLAPGCPGNTENLYAYEAGTRSLRCLTTEPPTGPPGKFGYFPIYGGASEDGSRVFFKSKVRYAGVPAGTGYSLYEAHEGQIHAVSVLPGETSPAAPTPGTTFGMKTGEGAQTGQSVLHNAVSTDGTKAIWTYVPTSGPSQLLDRINGSETVQVDKVQSGGGSPGEGTFWAASADGQVIYFTSPNRLVTGAKAGPGAEDLYRYDFSKALGSRLQDLTIKGNAPGEVKGVIGTSEDGQVVYFVSGSALTEASEENQAGQHAETGKDNLYVYDAGENKKHFVARLSGEDSGDWESQPKSISARVSPDGQHLAFLSTRAEELAGFDNTLAATKGKFAGTEECQIDAVGILHGTSACPEAFLYDKQVDSFTCASCNPAGSRPLGPALLPGWSSMSEGPRYLSTDGGRLFFETYDRLLPDDEDNLRDVYEFERPGSGTCTAQSRNYDAVSGGCHFLVSSGRSTDESFLIDASTTGRDVFFSTRSALTGWDTNENYDVYDFREGGGFAEPVPSAEPCGGEGSCKPPATGPPSAPTPATPSFTGPGNPKQKKPKPHHKKKHKRHHKKKGKAKKHGASKKRSTR